MIESAIWFGGVLMLAYPLAAWHWLGYRSWTSTTATVVRLQDDPTLLSDQGPMQSPVFRFQIKGGEWIEVVDPVFSNTRLRVGSVVKIIYPESSPPHARLASNLYTLPLVLGTIGLAIALIGVFGGA